MKKAYLVVRCAVLWVISLAHFGLGVLLLMLLALFVEPRKSDRVQRIFARNVLRLAGVRLRVSVAPGFDPRLTSIFICNHVNLFDPFVLYSAIPQFLRGWELESHFKIPFYGWLMRRFGNIPVADQRTPGSIRRLLQQTKTALHNGISLVVFPEGGRTTDGEVKTFEQGIFRFVRDLKAPIVPVSITGSFEFNRKDSYWLKPSTIAVYIHDTIDTQQLCEAERAQLCERVHGIISQQVETARGKRGAPGSVARPR